MKKVAVLPPPSDVLISMFGPDVKDCNNSIFYNEDNIIVEKFKAKFLEDSSCILPYFGTGMDAGAELMDFCAKQTAYNSTTG